MIDDEDIKRIINESTDLEAACNMLIETANANGGRDNISVILIDPDYEEVKAC